MEQDKHTLNALLEDLIGCIKKFIDDLFKSFFGKKVDLDTLAHQLEERFQSTIEETLKQEAGVGILTIYSVTESRFSYRFSLYFHNTQEKWIERSINSDELDTTLYLTDEAVKELHEKKEIQYELELSSHKKPSSSATHVAEAPQESKSTSAPSPQELPEKSENISAPNT